jgi:hypothetical protein
MSERCIILDRACTDSVMVFIAVYIIKWKIGHKQLERRGDAKHTQPLSMAWRDYPESIIIKRKVSCIVWLAATLSSSTDSTSLQHTQHTHYSGDIGLVGHWVAIFEQVQSSGLTCMVNESRVKARRVSNERHGAHQTTESPCQPHAHLLV